MNKAASHSTLTSFKRPLLKAPGSGKHGLPGLCQQRGFWGIAASRPHAGLQLHGRAGCPMAGGEAVQAEVGPAGLCPGQRGSRCLEAVACCSLLMLRFTVCQPSTCGVGSQCGLSSPLGSQPGKLLRAIPNSKCKDLTSGWQPFTNRAETSRPIPPAEAQSSRVLGDAEPQLCTVGIHSIAHFFFCRTVKHSGP